MDTPNRVSELYDLLLLEQKKVTIRFPSFREYETLRVALSKRNKLMTALDISDRSVIARWSEEDNLGTFALDYKANREKQHSWQIVSVSDATASEQRNEPEV